MILGRLVRRTGQGSLPITRRLARASLVGAAAAGFAATPPTDTHGPAQAGLPLAVDLRPQFEAYGLGRSRQGNRPTCSVFTVVGALELAIAKRQGHCPRLSVEFLNWAANQVAGDTQDGGFFSDLWKGFATYGICVESEFPYQDKFEPKRRPPPEALAEAQTRLGLGLRWHWIKEWNVHTGLTESQLEAIKQTLHRGWPVCGGFRWPKQEQWVESVLQMCPSNAVRDGHSVLLVGYQDDPNQPRHGVFIFRNTSRAGQDGQMPYDYARAYMNDAGWIDFESRAERAARGAAAGPALLNDLLGPLLRLPGGRSRRISSNQQPRWNDANLHMTVLPPGRAVELPVLEGPGLLTHMGFTSHAGRVACLLSLREQEP